VPIRLTANWNAEYCGIEPVAVFETILGMHERDVIQAIPVLKGIANTPRRRRRKCRPETRSGQVKERWGSLPPVAEGRISAIRSQFCQSRGGESITGGGRIRPATIPAHARTAPIPAAPKAQSKTSWLAPTRNSPRPSSARSQARARDWGARSPGGCRGRATVGMRDPSRWLTVGRLL